MKQIYFLGLLLLSGSVSVLAQKNQILPQKQQDSILQKLQQPGFPSINKPFKAFPLDPELLNFKENSVVAPAIEYSMPIYRPDEIYNHSMRILKPSKAYEYKMRIIDQPVQNSQRDQS
ncbi:MULTISPECIES: hypothetical protein [unclassified Leeuwenhoekiella]|uniref:hypothetical protein n=1 Tax=unclassified Leeuwenhoekiella TaxID=2615029 RepID=UPI000C355B1B|nr:MULTISPECIES: hypothetical protein [unclassified Leeuwenhoekiella]MAW95622.1 hypothetical protein [Leeuwenhoekiella sp.]MBA82286.1 hypothetical protein [Leeuwenhoekiella sp.]|tara:strand:- start:1613 stop:1966 length:354 start_codon:yes stop_codon:yes gene_type:complete